MPIIKALETFIRPHPVLHPDAGDIFTPREGYAIRFFFEGGTTIAGSGPTLEINFNDPDLLILSTGNAVTRFGRSALLGFELLTEDQRASSTADIKGLRLVFRTPDADYE